MARHESGTFRRVDRVQTKSGIAVRLAVGDSTEQCRALLLELGMTDLLLTGLAPLALGTRVTVGITLPARFLEIQLCGMVSWHLAGEFGVSFAELSARQTYGLVLAIDLLSRGESAGVLAEVSSARQAQREEQLLEGRS